MPNLKGLSRAIKSSIPDEFAYRLLSLDPGTDTLGWCVFRIDVRTGDIEVEDAGTYHASRRIDLNSTVYLEYCTRTAKVQEQRGVVTQLLYEHEPHAVGCEVPFIGRFAQSGMALSELYAAIQTAIIDYSPMVAFVGVDNRSAKLAVGAKVPSKGEKKLGKKMKDVVREAVLNLIDLVPIGTVRIEKLDEHAIDACAVGYYVTSLIRAAWNRTDKHVMAIRSCGRNGQSREEHVLPGTGKSARRQRNKS